MQQAGFNKPKKGTMFTLFYKEKKSLI